MDKPNKLIALVTMEITCEAEVDIETEGVRVKLPRDPWSTCDAKFRPLIDTEEVETTMQTLEAARKMLRFAIVNRLAATNALPEGATPHFGLAATGKEGAN